jgi:Domain of unknown function (DUF5625)
MSENYRLTNRRTVNSLLSLFPWLSKVAFASGLDLPTAPCSFPFDASRKDTALNVQFRVKTYRNYIFTLEFHYEKGNGMRVRELVGDGAFKYFTKESADTDYPVLVTAPTLEASYKRDAGLRNGDVVSRQTNFSGDIPIHLRVIKADSATFEVIANEVVQTFGHFRGGQGSIDRVVTVIALKPGVYRLEANTTQDTPRFATVSIDLGVTYQPKTLPLSLKK